MSADNPAIQRSPAGIFVTGVNELESSKEA